MNLKKILDDEIVKIIRLAVTELPLDVEDALRKSLREENTELGKMNLEIMLENIKLARKLEAPLCQDTGILTFFIKDGLCQIKQDEIIKILRSCVERATVEIPLRPCVVNPFTRLNTDDNTGKKIPFLYLEHIPEDYIEITVLPKGAGSENMSKMCMLTPKEGSEGITKFVLETVINAGGKSCPPIKLGIGIGGSSDVAMKLSKEALIRPLNTRHPDTEVANLEKELFEMINATGLGPMGLGGKVTVLGVNIEYADCHTASLPLGVNIQCWADRRGTMRVYENGKVEYLTHRRI